MRTMLIAAAALLAASPCASAQQERSPYREARDRPSAETILFWSYPRMILGDPPPSEAHIGLMVVFMGGARGETAGVSAIVIDKRVTCATGAVSTLAYASYSADATLMSRSAAPPSAFVRFDSNPSEATIERLCEDTRDYLPITVDEREGKIEEYQPERVQDVAAALSYARRREQQIAAARALPQDGRFFVRRITRGGALVLDFAQREQIGSRTRISYILVFEGARGRGPTRWFRSRASYLVDCAQRRGAREYVAMFEASGELLDVDGPTADAPLERFEAQYVLLEACAMNRPPGQTFDTLSEALAAARATER